MASHSHDHSPPKALPCPGGLLVGAGGGLSSSPAPGCFLVMDTGWKFCAKHRCWAGVGRGDSKVAEDIKDLASALL